jgi:hypothetical protein
MRQPPRESKRSLDPWSRRFSTVRPVWQSDFEIKVGLQRWWTGQYDILYALYILGRCVPCTRGAIKKPDPEKFKADDAVCVHVHMCEIAADNFPQLPPTGEDTRVGGGKATGGLTGGVTGGIGGII